MREQLRRLDGGPLGPCRVPRGCGQAPKPRHDVVLGAFVAGSEGQGHGLRQQGAHAQRDPFVVRRTGAPGSPAPSGRVRLCAAVVRFVGN